MPVLELVNEHPDEVALHDLARSLAQGDGVPYSVGTRRMGVTSLLDTLDHILQHFDGPHEGNGLTVTRKSRQVAPPLSRRYALQAHRPVR
jgi:hypothetical protein